MNEKLCRRGEERMGKLHGILGSEVVTRKLLGTEGAQIPMSVWDGSVSHTPSTRHVTEPGERADKHPYGTGRT
jgi:hypothetical protein